MSTMPLPAPLQGWAPWLNWFTPELVAEIGPLLIRLHPLLGRFKGQRQGGPEEPDGVGDLRRKGSYERLLTSEWLLATEMPDEFLRRAASSEHLFLAPRLRAQSADKLVVALFDSGPWQLGAPRLAQMALWILLARRAVEAGGEMRWGSLQRPGQWYESGSPEDLKKFLSMRCFDAAETGHWNQWSDWLAAHADGMGECWLVGHERDAARRTANPPTHAVQLRRGLGGDSLDVSLRAGTALRTMQLPLPAPEAAAVLLKGRFQSDAPQAAPHAIRSDKLSLRFAPIIAAQGHRVAVPLLDERGVMVFQTLAGSDPKRHKPQRQNWSKGMQPLAAAFFGKVFGALVSGQEQLQFWQMADMGKQARPTREAFEAPPGRGALLPLLWGREGSRRGAYAIDTADRLVCWMAESMADVTAGNMQPELVDKNVLAMASISGLRIVYVSRDVSRVWVRFAGPIRSVGNQQTVNLSLDPGPDTKAFMAGGARWQYGFGGVAVRMSADNDVEGWRVFEEPTGSQAAPGSWEARLGNGQRAVGLVRLHDRPGYALVVQSANRRQIMLESPTRTSLVWQTTEPIERVSVCPHSALVAMLSSERTLHVWSARDQALSLTVHSSGPAEKAEVHDAP